VVWRIRCEEVMTRQEANQLLDRVKDGADINFRLIRQALEATGDEAPVKHWTSMIEPGHMLRMRDGGSRPAPLRVLAVHRGGAMFTVRDVDGVERTFDAKLFAVPGQM
jgi:hypothetical protein